MFQTIEYRGVPLARPVRRVDGLWQCQTRVDRAFFGPAWRDTDAGWTAARQWLESTGHRVLD